MEIREMTHADIEKRLNEIDDELKAEEITEEKVEELEKEVDDLKEREEEIKQEAEEKKEEARKALTTNNVIESRKENKKMETRKNEIYDALAEVIKGKATDEQRALLSTNVEGGTINISTIVDDFVWTDWNKSEILSRVRKSYVRGNYAVSAETSATGAVLHTEGTDAPTEEALTLTTINFIAEYYKKWIRVSDVVMALRGREFLDYLLDEFGHQLAVALENAIVSEIATSTLSAKVTHAIDENAVLAGFTALSDEAQNPVCIMSKATYATLRGLRSTTGQRLEDVFEGMDVLFNNTVNGILVGDLDGVIVNFPDGEDFKFIVDETTLAESDMIKIVGKILASAHLVRPNGFAVVTAGE